MATMRLTLALVTCLLCLGPSTSHGVRTAQREDMSCDVRWLTVPLGNSTGPEVLHFVSDFPGRLSVNDDLAEGYAPTVILEIKGDERQTANVRWRQVRREGGALLVHVYLSDYGGSTNLTKDDTLLQLSSGAQDNAIVVTVVILVAVFIVFSIFAFIYLQEKRRAWYKKRQGIGSSSSRTTAHGSSNLASFREYNRRRLHRGKSGLDCENKETDEDDTDGEEEHSAHDSGSGDVDEKSHRARRDSSLRIVFNSSSETLPPSILKKSSRNGHDAEVSRNGCPDGARSDFTSEDIAMAAEKGDVAKANVLVHDERPDVVDIAVDVKPRDFPLPSDANKDSVIEDFEHFTRNMKTQKVTFVTSTPLSKDPCNKTKTTTGEVHMSDEDSEDDHGRETGHKLVCAKGEHDSGTEADDEGNSRWRSKGRRGPPLGKKMLFITVCMCLLACMVTFTTNCPVTVHVQLHIPNDFLAPGSKFVLHRRGDVKYTPWLRRATAHVYRYVNSSEDGQFSRDLCAERVPSEECEHTCNPDTGECSCMNGYTADQRHTHLCVRTRWSGRNRFSRYDILAKGYDIRMGQQPANRIFRSTYGEDTDNMFGLVKPEQLSVRASSRCLPSVVNMADSWAGLRNTLLDAVSFTGEDDFARSFGLVYNKDGVTENEICSTGLNMDTTGCQCPSGLSPTRDGSGCYDRTRDVDCSDGYGGGCDHSCTRVNTSYGNLTRVRMTCSCRKGYRLAADGRTCLFLPVCNATRLASGGCHPGSICHTTVEGNGTCSCNLACCRHIQVCKTTGACESRQCVQKPTVRLLKSTPPDEHPAFPMGFRQMQYGYNRRTRRLADAPIFQLTYSTNYSLSPILVPDEVDVALAEPTACQNYTGPVMDLRQQANPTDEESGRPYLRARTPEVSRHEEMKALGFLFSQELAVFRKEYLVQLKHATLTTDLRATLGRLTANSPRSDFIHVLEKYGTHYISQAVFGHGEEQVVYYKSRSLDDWRRSSFAVPGRSQAMQSSFTGALAAQEDARLSSGERPTGIPQASDNEQDGDLRGDRVQVVRRTWGGCPEGGCCRRTDAMAAEPGLLQISRTTALYELMADQQAKEVFRRAFLSYLWCKGVGEVVGETCRCDVDPSNLGMTRACTPPPVPRLYRSTTEQSTDVTLTVAWQHVGQHIGVHVTDYQFIVREVRSADIGLGDDDFDKYPELVQAFLADEVFNGADSCYGRGLAQQGAGWTFSLLLLCLKPDTVYRISVRTVTGGGVVSPADVMVLRTECQTTQLDHQPAGVADALYNLYSGYTSPLAQDMAFRILTTLNTIELYDVVTKYEEKYDDFFPRTQEELGLARTLLVRTSLRSLSDRCKSEVKLGKVVRKVRKRFRCSFGGTDTSGGMRGPTLLELQQACVKYDEKYNMYERTSLYG